MVPAKNSHLWRFLLFLRSPRVYNHILGVRSSKTLTRGYIMKRQSNLVLAVVVILFAISHSTFAGKIVAWGNSTWDLNVPPAGDDFIAVSAGSYTKIGLKSDGSVVVWGATGNPPFNVPAVQDFVAIDEGYVHVLAIRSDGSLAAWGNNVYGQCDVPSGNDFIAIAAGNWHSLALRTDGSIEAFGDNYYGQLDVPEGNDYIAIAAGHDSCLAIRSDGSHAAWGWNHDGVVTNLPGGNDFTDIAVGTFGAALREDGTLVNWGTAYVVPAGNGFVAIEAGKNQCFALCADGSLVGWGSNGAGATEIPAIPAGYVFTDFGSGDSTGVGLIAIYHPADTDSDYVISISEIVSYINKWSVGEVTISDVVKAINLWAAGHYYWDESEQKFKPGEKP